MAPDTQTLLHEVRMNSSLFHQWCHDNPDAIAAARAAGGDPKHRAYIETEAKRLFEDDIGAANAMAAASVAREASQPTSARTALRQLIRSV